MKILIEPDSAAAARLAAHIVLRQLAAQPRSVLGLATGRTMERIYAALAATHRAGQAEFSGCTSFNLDEYCGLPADDPRSYRHFMQQRLFEPVGIPKARAHLPDGRATDPVAEGQRYEAAIAEAGGIDLQLLGIGATGHIGFNEPLAPFRSRTRRVTLAPLTRAQNAPMFGGDPAQVPTQAMTMGIATILEARRIVLVATGEAKAEMLARAVEGPLTAMVSGSALQMHPDCLVISDERAARRLSQRDYYDWMRGNDPDLAALLDGRPGERSP